MKKLILIAICLAVSFSSYSQPDTTKLTANKIYEDLKQGIQGAAKALKAPAEHVYTIMVRQQVVNSISLSILPLLVIICAVIISRLCKHTLAKDGTLTGYGVGVLIFGIIGIGLLIATAINLPDIMTGFVNPEYGAIRDILTFIK